MACGAACRAGSDPAIVREYDAVERMKAALMKTCSAMI
jgi:hypothetical protein